MTSSENRRESFLHRASTAATVADLVILFGGIFGPGAGLAAPAGDAHVPSKAALAALPATAFPVVIRDAYATPGDSPPLTYVSSASACSLNAGAGDGGAQIPTRDKGCWNAVLPKGGLRIEWWGRSPANLSALVAGSAGRYFDLYLGASVRGATDTDNDCQLAAAPCKTLAHAALVATQFDSEGADPRILAVDATATTYQESVSFNGPPPQAANADVVPQNRGLWTPQYLIDGGGVMTIAGAPGGACFGVGASNNAIVGLRRVTVSATGRPPGTGGGWVGCMDSLFAQLNGGINVFDGVTLGPSGGDKLHTENSAYGIEFWGFTTVATGNSGGSLMSAGANSMILMSGPAGSGTGAGPCASFAGSLCIAGAPTIRGAFLYIGANSTFQTNFADPFGANPGTLSDGAAFVVEPTGMIESNAQPIHWPGSTQGVLLGSGAYRVMGASFAGPTATSTGLGAGGSSPHPGVAFRPGSDSRQGAIILHTGASGTGAAGTITVSMPVLVRMPDSRPSPSFCIVGPTADAASHWAPGSLFEGGAQGATTYFYWNNSGASLAVNSTYAIAYRCG
jgi:hypothetical protein